MELNEISYCSKSAFPWEDNPFRLWSLLDMLKVSAEAYIRLGEAIDRMSFNLLEAETHKTNPITNEELKEIKDLLVWMKKHCDKLELKISSSLLDEEIKNLPPTYREFNLLVNAIRREIRFNLFLFIPTHRAKYYEQNLPEYFTASFTNASKEIIRAGNCFATGEYTACVFHCMRGAELGLRSLAKHLNIPQDLDLEQWKNIIDQIEKEIKAKQDKMKKSSTKNEELKLLSNAASQFRYFKDAYRNHVAHARSTYDDGEAERIITGTQDFLQSLSSKLKE